MRLFVFVLLLFILQEGNAQTVEQVSVGSSYSQQSFYKLSDGSVTTIDSDTWDLAFSTFGLQDAGIFVNEAAPSMGIELELYDLGVLNFDAEISEDDLQTRSFNPEQTWTEGAFNVGRDTLDFTDYGWGSYVPSAMSVMGEKLFVLKLRNGTFKKLMIESLIGTVYTLRYADFDGTNEKTVEIDKTEFQGKQMAYFSFDTEEVMDLEPMDWDLLFTRYSSPVPDGEGEILNYVVTGVLMADGVETAQANEINPLTVSESNFKDAYDTDIDAIGFDWKEIDISTFQWTILLDRVYFVKDKAGDKYQLFFIDFEGSSTGISTFEKSTLVNTSVSETWHTVATVSPLYPNPSPSNFSFSIENVSGSQVIDIHIFDLLGNKQTSFYKRIHGGKQEIDIHSNLRSGEYIVQIIMDGHQVVRKLVVR